MEDIKKPGTIDQPLRPKIRRKNLFGRWVVHVQDNAGRQVGSYDAERITRDWLLLTAAGFKNKYGFSFVPPIWLREKVKKRGRKSNRNI